VDSAGSFSDELDDTYYLSSDGIDVQVLRGIRTGCVTGGFPLVGGGNTTL
jgi:hypothetical protein